MSEAMVRSPPQATWPRGEPVRYTRLAIALHWATATLVLINVPLGILHEAIEAEFGQSPMWIHKSTGLTVLLLSVARLAWRVAHRPPPLPLDLPRWQAAAARAAHRALA